jgi:hypothetical protein
MRMWRHPKNHWPKILTAGTITAIGLLLFKYLPMSIWGRDILFDASGHIAWAIFVLYALWFFVDQNKSWHTPFFIFGAMVLMVIAFQRIADHAHNDIGLLGGLILGGVAIGVAEWTTLKHQLNF